MDGMLEVCLVWRKCERKVNSAKSKRQMMIFAFVNMTSNSCTQKRYQMRAAYWQCPGLQ